MFGTYQRLHVTIHASAREVIRAASRKLRPEHRFGAAMRSARHNFYREMLAYHSRASEMAKEFRL